MRLKILIGLSLISASAACSGQAPEAGSGEEATATQGEDLFVKSGDFWPASSPGATPVINVCWENPTTANASQRTWIQDTIVSQWGRYGRIAFTGWGTCTTGQAGIHVFDSSAGSTPANGVGGNTIIGFSGINGATNGLQMNMTGDCRMPDTPGAGGTVIKGQEYPTNEHCIRGVALHEFGHALGFAHEEARPDYVQTNFALADCQKQTTPSNYVKYGAYDINSTMSYCGQPGTGSGTFGRDDRARKEVLSAGDIASIQALYGRRIGGSVLSTKGRCLAMNPNDLFLWDCLETGGTTGTEVVVHAGIKTHNFYQPLLVPGANQCIQWNNPAQRVTSSNTCSSTFAMYGVAIRGWGGKCLDLANGSTTNGGVVQMWDCLGDWADPQICPPSGSCPDPGSRPLSSNANQIWTYGWSDTARIAFGANQNSSGFCLTHTAAGANGDRLTVTPCSLSNNNQLFYFERGNITLATNENTCLDVPAPTTAQYLGGQGLPVNGTQLQTFACTAGQTNQGWNVTGPISFSTNAAIARQGETDGSIFIGTNTVRAPSAEENWDQYWQ